MLNCTSNCMAVKNFKQRKSARQMERHLKGIANHHRITALLLIESNPGIALDLIVSRLQANEKTIGEHVRRLHGAGLVNKKYRGHFVEHSLSPYGVTFVKFLKTFRDM